MVNEIILLFIKMCLLLYLDVTLAAIFSIFFIIKSIIYVHHRNMTVLKSTAKIGVSIDWGIFIYFDKLMQFYHNDSQRVFLKNKLSVFRCCCFCAWPSQWCRNYLIFVLLLILLGTLPPGEGWVSSRTRLRNWESSLQISFNLISII